jgi:hypothetical protein
MKDYPIHIFPSDEDQAYIADIPDLSPCSPFGPTPKPSLHELQLPKTARLQSPQDLGKPIPPPRYRPAIYHPAS